MAPALKMSQMFYEHESVKISRYGPLKYFSDGKVQNYLRQSNQGVLPELLPITPKGIDSSKRSHFHPLVGDAPKRDREKERKRESINIILLEKCMVCNTGHTYQIHIKSKDILMNETFRRGHLKQSRQTNYKTFSPGTQ